VLQGDAIKTEAKFIADPDGFGYASELLEHVVKMNKGIYLDEELHEPSPTNFCIGVAGYPEKHFNAPNLKTDMKYLKSKVEKGAEYIVTQMFFDNKKYFEFVEKCRESGITVPIIPGIKPLTTKGQLTVLPQIFHIDLPEELSEEAEKCKDNVSVKQVGIEWTIKQCKELIKSGAPTIHFYSMGKSDPIYRIAKELF
jgi:methylenetetrahydrofolate reductase (NADPH)